MTGRTAEQGVYYDRSDYCGVTRRLTVDVIDVVAAFVLWFIACTVFDFFKPEFAWTFDAFVLSLLLIWFIYFVILKASPLRTLGYRVGRVKAVDLHGGSPGFLAHCLRFLFTVLGPVNFLIDLLWLSTDPHGQTIRDKLAHIYVVRLDAKPRGVGAVVYRNYHILGYTFIFREVQPTSARPLTTGLS